MCSAFREIIKLEEVGFSYDKSGFISGLGLNIGEAEFIGLIGANGSGKSTVLKLMAGLLAPSAGEIELWGKRLKDYRNKDRAKLISYLPQSLDMNVPFTASEIVGMGRYPYDRITSNALSINEALGLVGLTDKSERLLIELSGGERRRVFIAMTLMQGAGMLLLDEPLANLDVRYQMEIIRLLTKLNTERSITIVMAIHDINLAAMFKRLLIIKQGRLIADGAPNDVLDSDILADAFDLRLKVVRSENGTFISYDGI